MKKKIFVLFTIVVVALPCFAQKSQGMDIDKAIDAAATQIAAETSGKTVAVIRFTADTEELSTYLKNRIIDKLSGKNVRLVARDEKFVDDELDYQYSGAVNDNTIVEFGKATGAKYIVYGSFEQYVKQKIFDFRLIEVETREFISKSYNIASSDKLIGFLGDKIKPESVTEYASALSRLKEKKDAVNKEKDDYCESSKNKINAQYQEEINKKRKEIENLYDGMIFGKNLENKIAEAIKPLESKRDEDLKPVEKNSELKFADQISSIDNTRLLLINDIEGCHFVIDGEFINTQVLEKNDDIQEVVYFDLTLRSTDRYVKYSIVNERHDPINPNEFKTIRNAAKNNTIKGEITYTLKHIGDQDSLEFNITITNVRIYDAVFGYNFYKKSGSELANTNGGTMNMAARKDGSSADAKKKTDDSTNVKNSVASNNASAASTKPATDANTPATSTSASKKSKPWWRDDYDYHYINFGAEYSVFRNHYIAESVEFEDYLVNTTNYRTPVTKWTANWKALNFFFAWGYYFDDWYSMEWFNINFGLSGFHTQLCGCSFENRIISFRIYPMTFGFISYKQPVFNYSFLDMKFGIKAAKSLTFEFGARLCSFARYNSRNYDMCDFKIKKKDDRYEYKEKKMTRWAPAFSVGVNIPIRLM